MSIEYQQRGVLHKLTNTKKLCPQQSKNVLIKWTTKTALAAETAVLFSKDVAVNRFVGKETHIKFERSQNESGKFKTHIKLVRAEAPQQLPKGVLHKLNNINRFVEGDKPLQKKPKIKYEPKSLKGEMAYGALSSSKAVVKNSAKFAKATALTGETVLTKAGSTGLRQIQYKLRNNSDVHDSGKAVMTGITALQTINRGRKYLINYRRSRAAYKQQKITFEGQKQQLKTEKAKYSGENQKYKLQKKQLKNKLSGITTSSSVRQKRKIVLRSKVKYQKQLNRSNKAVYKNFKKQKKFAKKEARQSKVLPIAALPLVPLCRISQTANVNIRKKSRLCRY